MSGRLGIFEAIQRSFRAADEEKLMRNAAYVASVPRGRKIFFLKDGFEGELKNAGGITTRSGNIFISGDVRGKEELVETVRHELFHSVLTPRSRPLNYVHHAMLGRSSVYLYLHEAGAQAYGTRSLWQGAKYPIKYGYVRPTWLVAELTLLGVLGYDAANSMTK